MGNKAKMLLVSMSAVCISAVIVLGGTYALFTDEINMQNQLVAGNLDVDVACTAYEKCYLAADGTLVKEIAEAPDQIDLANGFSMTNSVPGCYQQATMEVTNEGSTAFNYGVRVVWHNDASTQLDDVFAEQIKITITSDKIDGGVKEFYLNADNKDVPLQSILAGSDAADTVTIRAEFDNSEKNKDAMNATVNFTVQLYAVQKTN